MCSVNKVIRDDASVGNIKKKIIHYFIQIFIKVNYPIYTPIYMYIYCYNCQNITTFIYFML